MKRIFVVSLAGFALLLPTLTFAQDVKTVYRPEVHGTTIVAPEAATPVTNVREAAAPVAKAEKAARTPEKVIAFYTAMGNAYRVSPRVNYSAVAYCDRKVADAQAELRKKR